MQSLYSRIHILPATLAQSPGSVSAALPLPTRLMAATEGLLAPLPAPLIDRWLAAESGHIVIDAYAHNFIAGPNQVHKRVLQDVAWVRASILVEDAATFLIPAGQLILHLIRDRWRLEQQPAPAAWVQFWSGVLSCHRAGYAATPEARANAGLYLAEGIARWLVDRRSLNLEDPRLEKLLAATLFDAHFYRKLG